MLQTRANRAGIQTPNPAPQNNKIVMWGNMFLIGLGTGMLLGFLGGLLIYSKLTGAKIENIEFETF